MEAGILRTVVGLGVPGVALGIFYLLLRQFGFQFSTIDPTASACIAILFLLIVGGVTLYALRHTKAIAAGQGVDRGIPPAHVVEMFRALLQQVDLGQEGSVTRSSKANLGYGDQGAIDRTKIGKFLALVLRHRPETAALKPDNQGWVDVATLISGVNAAGYRLSPEDLELVVGTSTGKGGTPRFSFSPDKRRVRANWGHSFPLSTGG